MLSITEIVKSSINSAHIPYSHFKTEDNLDAIRIPPEHNDNPTGEFFIMIEDNGETAFVRSLSSAKIPENRLSALLSLLIKAKIDLNCITFNPENGNELIIMKEEFVTAETAVKLFPLLLMRLI